MNDSGPPPVDDGGEQALWPMDQDALTAAPGRRALPARSEAGSPQAPGATAEQIEQIVRGRIEGSAKALKIQLSQTEAQILGAIGKLRETEGTPDLKGETEKLKAVAEGIARQLAAAPDAGAAAGGIEKEIRLFRTDVERARRVQRRSAGVAAVIALLAAAPVLFGLGLAVQQQLSVLPEMDPTGGWRAYVWERYGEAIVGCERRAQQTDAAVSCAVVVGEDR